MRPVTAGGVTLEFESPEAGRYQAPILILPGLFQSTVCWRGMTSMLAHRGWEVYVLPRCPHERSGPLATPTQWNDTLEATVTAASTIAERIIVLGADVGAALALASTPRVQPLALGLFAPARPSDLGRSYRRVLGMLGRRRGAAGPWTSVPRRLAKTSYQNADVSHEPSGLLDDLIAGVPFEIPAEHPPAVVFPAENDPLVQPEWTSAFMAGRHAQAARTALAGRWWPSLGWEAACNEAHRFLVLTLGDRVVEFPDEVFDD